jgi:hypothetical protein
VQGVQVFVSLLGGLVGFIEVGGGLAGVFFVVLVFCINWRGGIWG